MKNIVTMKLIQNEVTTPGEEGAGRPLLRVSKLRHPCLYINIRYSNFVVNILFEIFLNTLLVWLDVQISSPVYLESKYPVQFTSLCII